MHRKNFRNSAVDAEPLGVGGPARSVEAPGRLDFSLAGNGGFNWLMRYRRERFSLVLFGAVAVLLLAASYSGGRPFHPWRSVGEWVLALGLLFQFRLWDDRNDLDWDRRHHPGRVLTELGAEAWGGRWLALASFGNAAGAWLALTNSWSWGALLALWFGAFVFYRRPRADRLLAAHCVALKYPGLALALAGRPEGAREFVFWSVCGLVYFAFVAHELLHDRERQGARAWPWLRGELGLLGVGGIMLGLALMFGPFPGRGGEGEALLASGAAGIGVYCALSRVPAGASPWVYRLVFLPLVAQLAVLFCFNFIL